MQPVDAGRWMLAVVAALAVAGAAGQAGATPARAQALGGYDLNYPGSIDTFVYFEDDVNIFVNPALIYRYRDMVQASIGFKTSSNSGMGLSPYGGFLFEPLDTKFVFGLFVNRDPLLWGEGAAIQPVINGLIPGGWGGSFDTASQGGMGDDYTSTGPKFPLDLFLGGAVGPFWIGFNGYLMGGSTTSHSEELLNLDDGTYAVNDAQSKSLYASARVGFVYDGDYVQPEVYAAYTGVAGWASAFAHDTERGEGEPSISHTEGMKGVGRFAGGARVHIRTNYHTITPHIGYATGWGKTFVDENLGDQVAIENLQNNDNRYTSMDLNAGVGLTYEPEDPLRVVLTASAQLRRLRHRMDDHAYDLDEDVGDVSSTQLDESWTSFAGPVVSVGAEYEAFRHLTLRAGVRANVLWGRDVMSSTSYYGVDTTSTSTGGADSSPTPSLSATAGFTIPVGPLDLDAALGGLVIGSADMQFFSRLDMRIYLP